MHSSYKYLWSCYIIIIIHTYQSIDSLFHSIQEQVVALMVYAHKSGRNYWTHKMQLNNNFS